MTVNAERKSSQMEATDVIRRLHEHRAWVNANLLASVRDLSEEQLQRPFAIGQGSIWKSLTHLYAAEYVWLQALLGEEAAVLPGDLPDRLPGNQMGEGKISGLDELTQDWSTLNQRWTEYLNGLSASSLDEIVMKKSINLGVRFGASRADVLIHVCTHAHYTVAQVVNMLRQTGVAKLPNTMLMALARLQGQ